MKQHFKQAAGAHQNPPLIRINWEAILNSFQNAPVWGRQTCFLLGIALIALLISTFCGWSPVRLWVELKTFVPQKGRWIAGHVFEFVSKPALMACFLLLFRKTRELACWIGGVVGVVALASVIFCSTPSLPSDNDGKIQEKSEEVVEPAGVVTASLFDMRSEGRAKPAQPAKTTNTKPLTDGQILGLWASFTSVEKDKLAAVGAKDYQVFLAGIVRDQRTKYAILKNPQPPKGGAEWSRIRELNARLVLK